MSFILREIFINMGPRLDFDGKKKFSKRNLYIMSYQLKMVKNSFEAKRSLEVIDKKCLFYLINDH